MLNRKVYVVNIIDYIQIVNTIQNMLYWMFPVVNGFGFTMAILLIEIINCCDEISDTTPIPVASRIARIIIRSKHDRSWVPVGSRNRETKNYWSDHVISSDRIASGVCQQLLDSPYQRSWKGQYEWICPSICSSVTLLRFPCIFK